MRIIKILVILLAIFSTQIGITNAMSIMPTNEIQAGMVGVAKTVIKGSAIEEFSNMRDIQSSGDTRSPSVV